MRPNPLRALPGLGQSVWMDYFRRNLLTSGELAKAIGEDDLRGVTSNPTIFEKAIAGSHDYDKQIRALALGGKSVEEILQELMVEDIRRAADVFRPAFDRLGGGDGFVSLEVSPHLAHDTRGTLAEARRLWAALDRPNVMIKVPATLEGLPAITALTAEGINVNITLLFGLPRYEQVAEAYLAGLEARVSRKQPVHTIASVASFFLSRIDVLLDPRLERIPELSSLRGEVAIASAKVAFQMYKRIFASERFRRLADQGARPQRLLWASTGTKDPAYPDLKYVEPLIGPDTINTMPVETMNAYRDHGNPAPRLEEGVDEARRVLERLAQGGVNLDEATREVEDQGVAKFIKPFDQLLKTLAEHREAARREAVDRQSVA
ncbi:MAG: transaldolase, partial [Myxococcaceae bacterium]